jgi:perosamine synthetase
MSASLPTHRRIPIAAPNIGPREVELVTDVLTSGTLAMGSYTVEFEERIAALVGRRHAIACSSGTAGLHMAVRALGFGPGDEIITTPFSFVASANCLLYEGAVPRFVDIEEDGLGLDPAAVAAVGADQVRGLLPVHVFGRPCRMDALLTLAGDRGWAVIEDSCEGLGSTIKGRPLGSFGDVSVFAFYPNKQITTGEGGIVVTDSDELAGTIRSLRNQGRDADSTWLRHVRLGYNYRLDEMSAAVGVAQLERLADLQAGRARVEACYRSALGAIDWLALPEAGPGESVDWFVYVVRLDPSIDRDRLIGELDGMGIQTRPYFSALHLQPLYRERFGYRPGDFPVTERVAATTLALPFSSLLPDDDVAFVAECLVSAVNALRH